MLSNIKKAIFDVANLPTQSNPHLLLLKFVPIMAVFVFIRKEISLNQYNLVEMIIIALLVFCFFTLLTRTMLDVKDEKDENIIEGLQKLRENKYFSDSLV